jgi:hypothetical protein
MRLHAVARGAAAPARARIVRALLQVRSTNA